MSSYKDPSDPSPVLQSLSLCREGFRYPVTQSATAFAPGAVSVLSSYAAGLGAAFAISLGITVTVSLTPTTGKNSRLCVVSEIPSLKTERLIKECMSGVFAYAGLSPYYAVAVSIESKLPAARGLKSSAALANAVVMAASRAVGIGMSIESLMSIARDAEVASGCSRFGSVDDGFSSLLGGLVFTETKRRSLFARRAAPEELDVIIMAPPESARHMPEGAREGLSLHKEEMTRLYDAALEGDLFTAMTQAGLIHARQFGYDADIILSAMDNGAEAATLSGKGPAMVALSKNQNTAGVIDAWSKYKHRLLLTKVDNKGGLLLKGTIDGISMNPRPNSTLAA